MQFQLTEEQKIMQKLVRDFAEKEVAPGAAERDEKEEFSREIADAMGEMGFAGICFPEQYGGADADVLSYILAVEELSRADAGVGITLSATVSLCAWPIFNFGTEEQKQKYLVPLAEGTKQGAFGLTEPNAGTDAASQQTVAVLDGDNYILNGSKIFITNAGEAEIYIVFAMTDKAKGVKGITAFILEKGMPGFTFGKKEHKMGIHSSLTNELIFQDVKVPKENMLGQEGQGFKIAMATLDGGRIGVAAQALGIAQAALEHAVKYAKERVQFGKPIANNQAIGFMLADMATKVDAARLLVYRAAYLKDQGLPYSQEAAMAKMYASDAAMAVATDAVQIFGGYGYSREYPVERLMRDAKITQIYEGTNQVQRMVISGSLLR
ncbi:acyl-CoA dehydrogenase [Sporomusa sphaeroides]|uniref:Acyl-CoA dehydrogenase, short-chain specific n=2 Tax=Sporomusa TaxID=2375 RepID=A0ABP2C8M6_9FIRM|nr:acyl-CoA dehydrogenase [Sporomusa sphaeroides]OLS56026.1 acyl-CoA dehydrogenase, short-chain specific [Sporomusa sphaeroides DSM 2875]CVK20237.1 Acyl-CoA dehydrogenase, short-chain specific [Sporomusa sphaeroides DSM 2875]SCM82732.1 Acyl-CoA dehydrogenase, short-chain specific [uncultured Sporomusa sp.]